MPVQTILCLIAGRVKRLPPGDTVSPVGLPTQASVIVLIGLQATALTTTSTTDALIPGTDFLWQSAYVPSGRSVFLEIVGNGSAATVAASVALYTAAGVLVAGAAVTAAGTAITRGRSTALTLVDNTTYQLRFKTTVAGTASIKSVRIIII